MIVRIYLSPIEFYKIIDNSVLVNLQQLSYTISCRSAPCEARVRKKWYSRTCFTNSMTARFKAYQYLT